MVGTYAGTESPMKAGRDRWDIGGDHPWLLQELAILTLDARSQAEGTTIKLGQREVLGFDEPCDLGLLPISAYSWPLEQYWDGAGAPMFPIQSHQLIEKLPKQLMMLSDHSTTCWVLTVRYLPR